MNGFVKIDCNILYSSIWSESSEIRIIWITMLAMANQSGVVPATAPGISSAAFISLSETRKAIAILEAPDPDSKSRENDGRRIERVEGGYLILNYDKYRSFNYSMKEAAIQKRAYRERHKKDNVQTLSGHSASASASEYVSKEEEKKETIQKKKDIDIFYDHLLNVLKITPSDKGRTKALLKLHGLEKMLAAVNRMRFYFDSVKSNGWTEYVISKYWRNLHEKIDYFISDESLNAKLAATAKSNKGNGLKPQESSWEKIHKYDADEDENKIPPSEEIERLQGLIAMYESEMENVSPEGMKRLDVWRKRLARLEGRP